MAHQWPSAVSQLQLGGTIAGPEHSRLMEIILHHPEVYAHHIHPHRLCRPTVPVAPRPPGAMLPLPVGVVQDYFHWNLFEVVSLWGPMLILGVARGLPESGVAEIPAG